MRAGYKKPRINLPPAPRKWMSKFVLDALKAVFSAMGGTERELPSRRWVPSRKSRRTEAVSTELMAAAEDKRYGRAARRSRDAYWSAIWNYTSEPHEIERLRKEAREFML